MRVIIISCRIICLPKTVMFVFSSIIHKCFSIDFVCLRDVHMISVISMLYSYINISGYPAVNL